MRLHKDRLRDATFVDIHFTEHKLLPDRGVQPIFGKDSADYFNVKDWSPLVWAVPPFKVAPAGM